MALFEIREARKCIKSMRVLFAPEIDISCEDSDYDNLMETILKIAHIVSPIFADVIKRVTVHESVKIYNDQQDVRIIFTGFAKFLQDESDKYSVKFYKNWIEISHKSKESCHGKSI